MPITQQEYWLKQGETPEQYNARMASLRGEPVYQPPLSETDQKKQEIAKLKANLGLAQGQLANAQAAGYSGKTEIPGNVLGASSPEEAKIAGLENVAFAQPTKTSTELYNELYEQEGLKNVKEKIDAIEQTINEKKRALNKEETDIIKNPWLSEASRVGRIKGLYEAALKDIQVDLDTQKLYQEQLNEGKSLIEKQVESQIEKETFGRELAQKQLEYLKPKAKSYSDIYGTGTIGEYNYYAEQEKAAGRTPLSFNEYQTLDANRKAQAAASANGLTTSESNRLMGITNKYQADTIVNNGNNALLAEEIANQAIANPGSAGNQLSLLYTLIKNLDPNSAVREGELALAQSTQSYLGKYQTQLDRISQGKIISEEATKELANATKNLAKQWKEAAQRREKQYQAQSNVLGVGNAFTDYLSQFERVYTGNPISDLEDTITNHFSEYQYRFGREKMIEDLTADFSELTREQIAQKVYDITNKQGWKY
jgi:hypothetical protein